MNGSAIFLHGPTSSGKTSLAKALQAASPVPAFHVSLDAFVCMTNRADMRSAEEESRVYAMHCDNLIGVLRAIKKSDFAIIVDLVLRDSAKLEHCIAAVAPRRTLLIGVTAPLEVLEAREEARDDRGTGMAREQFNHPAYRRQYDLIVDTSRVTAEQAAQRIRDLAGERG